MVDERDDATGEGRTPPTTPSPSVDPSSEGRTAPTAMPASSASAESWRAGQILGDRYEIRSRLGAGGMGEVWLATDLRLRIDVALKSVRSDYLANERLRELLRQEVLAAREVLSPNVCRVFDLQVTDGMELVSMEYVAGRTLAELLKERTPLPLREARDIAAQFLAGLEAVHDAGLVHRDFKPENVMITPVGRVVVMDLGLAARPELMDGGAAGTPAYMPPEQMRGGSVDARADVFAAGVVLAEMIAPAGIRNRDQRITLWEGLRSDPPRIPEGPWTPVIRKALSREPGDRFGSARELSRELDGLTLRVEEGESIEPYPGLAAFTEENAERFFGREAEVEGLLRKLGRARLLAIAGPSGAGKTSFVQAGLIPALPEGWGHVVVHPGDRPFEALARSFRGRRERHRRRNPPVKREGTARSAPVDSLRAQSNRRALGSASPAVPGECARTDLTEAIRRWRERHEQALLVVDQFEELFTLNTPETQSAFAQLLGRLPLEGDVHVLLSMRDDFLIRCREHDALDPAFAELTPLVHPAGAALRRALVQPALSCGYRFENEALVEAMLGQVEHERGALPLLAFAAAQLWRKRDPERGLLTRGAYEEIGGVGGALAHHAEETLQRIGTENIPIVRELLRNLVTAEGTRAARDRSELLSVFDTDGPGSGGPEPGRVLDALIDARLLSSYEATEPVRSTADETSGAQSSQGTLSESGDERSQHTPRTAGSGQGPRPRRTVHRIEIVHESLLSAWPRLVRWQTQDADAAQLRDQLRQAAQAWDERNRSADLLWAGSAYREFALWRERYPGNLSALEEDFAQAMTAQASRARRYRRIATATILTAVTVVAIAFAVLWRGSEEARKAAEAAQLLSLGRLRLEGNPTAALAHAIASLERADSEAGRHFALEALWQGPPYHQIHDPVRGGPVAWSRDGQWLALGGADGLVLRNRDSGARHAVESTWSGPVGFSADGSRFVTQTSDELHLWSLPDLQRLDSWAPPGLLPNARLFDRRLLVGTAAALDVDRPGAPVRYTTYEILIDTGATRVLSPWPRRGAVDGLGVWRASIENGRLVKHRLDDLDGPHQPLGEHDDGVRVWFHPWTDRVVTAHVAGELRIWDANGAGLQRTLRSPAEVRMVELDPSGRYLATAPHDGPLPPGTLNLFDLQAPRGATPLALQNDDVSFLNGMAFHPTGALFASGHYPQGITLWNLETRRPIVLEAKGPNKAIEFTLDGRLVAASDAGVVTVWPLWTNLRAEPRDLRSEAREQLGYFLSLSRDGQFAVALERWAGRVIVLPLDGSPPVIHEVYASMEEMRVGVTGSPTLSPGGDQLAVTFGMWGRPEAAAIRLVDLETGAVRTLRVNDVSEACEIGAENMGPMQIPEWLPDGRLISEGALGLRLWDLASGTSRLLRPCEASKEGPVVLGIPGSSQILTLIKADAAEGTSSSITVFDLESEATREVTEHGTRVTECALDTTGQILATADSKGRVRVGPLAGGEPHLLSGHQQMVTDVAISPDGQWVASASNDGTIRLWPMPDLTRPPLHAWPHEDLLDTLRALSNLRVVPDPEAASGYTVEAGPFPGWAEVPTW